MNSRFYWLIVVLILGNIAMGACTAPPAPAATSAPKPTATALSVFLTGIYRPDHKLNADSANYIEFSAQGKFEIGLPSDPRLGSYTVSGDQIVVNLDNGPCVNHPGTYHWEIHGNTLTLKPINDTCTASARSEDLGGRSWILQP